MPQGGRQCNLLKVRPPLLRYSVLQCFVYTDLYLRLSLILLRTVASCNLLRLSQIRTDSLRNRKVNEFEGLVGIMESGLTSNEKFSRGAASTALMVSLLLGCTLAKPPLTEK